MTKKPMFTHITLEIGNEHKEEAQAKDKAHAKNLGIIKNKLFDFSNDLIFFYFSCTKIIKKTSSTFTYIWFINSFI
jgi:hypothetical protein